MLERRIPVIPVLLVVLMLVSVFFGACGKSGGSEGPSSEAKPSENVTADEKADEAEETEAEETEVPEKTPAEPFDLNAAGLKAEKIGSIERSFSKFDGGLRYKDDEGKYGIMTLDGKKDTGAVYEYVGPEKNYFSVYTTIPGGEKDFDGLNDSALVDAEGNEVIPEHYAAYNVLGERFVRVIEVDKITDSKDDALFYLTDDMISLSADDDDTLYTGNWYIYDLTTGKKVDGAAGTQAYRAYEKGGTLEYTLDDETTVRLNAKLEKMPEDVSVYDNGCYVVRSDEERVMYASDGKELFSFTGEDFSVFSSIGDNFVVSRYKDGVSKYFVVDRSGKTVSAEFNDYMSAAGDYLKVQDSLYDYEGNKLSNDAYSSISFDDYRGLGTLLWNDAQFQLIAYDGTEIGSGKLGGDASVVNYQFVIKNGDAYYCWKDGDFTVKGRAISGALVISDGSDGKKELIDTVTGDVLISGYDDYKAPDSADNGFYVYAENSYDSYDVYLLK